MAKNKPNMNVVFVGHVDAGKSTCVGRMMFDGGAVTEQEMKKLREEAEKNGKAGFEFAYVMDKFKEESERGVTIDLSYQKLITSKYEKNRYYKSIHTYGKYWIFSKCPS
jgi:elongation factor 1-alpha